MSGADLDEHTACESIPEWDRYKLYCERAKTNCEIPMEFEVWKKSLGTSEPEPPRAA